jgi:hypothetical protein
MLFIGVFVKPIVVRFNSKNVFGSAGYLNRVEFRREYEKLDSFGSPPSRYVLDDWFSKYSAGDDRMGFDEFCFLMLQRAKW